MVAEALDIERETYFAILMDREYNGPVLVASPEGGVDIEEVAEKNPDAIFKVVLKFLINRLLKMEFIWFWVGFPHYRHRIISPL